WKSESGARALRGWRRAWCRKIREPIEADKTAPGEAGRLDLGRKDPRFWPTVGVVLDVLHATEARVSDAAKALGISTGNLIDFLQIEPKVWEQANILRARFGQKPLRGE